LRKENTPELNDHQVLYNPSQNHNHSPEGTEILNLKQPMQKYEAERHNSPQKLTPLLRIYNSKKEEISIIEFQEIMVRMINELKEETQQLVTDLKENMNKQLKVLKENSNK
jgi:hypothetical protein